MVPRPLKLLNGLTMLAGSKAVTRGAGSLQRVPKESSGIQSVVQAACPGFYAASVRPGSQSLNGVRKTSKCRDLEGLNSRRSRSRASMIIPHALDAKFRHIKRSVVRIMPLLPLVNMTVLSLDLLCSTSGITVAGQAGSSCFKNAFDQQGHLDQADADTSVDALAQACVVRPRPVSPARSSCAHGIRTCLCSAT